VVISVRSQRKPNSDYRNREHLLKSEVDALLEVAAEKSRYPARDYALILMTFRHGLRASEVAMLRWPDVDLAQQQLYIKRVKGSISGTHPLQPDELEAIQALRQDAISEIFVNERGKSFLVPAKRPGRADAAPGISRIIERIGQRADLGIKVHAHMLRHACGYWLAEQGYPTRDIQAYLGHRNIQNTVRYTAVNPARFAKFQWG
jgi:type 1 fimbriae regulatory protein FimB/type 1 fimbriae regulatory protein FimE